MSQVLDAIGLACLLALSAILVATFLTAYTSPTKSILVTVNRAGEATVEAVLLIAAVPLIARYALRALRAIAAAEPPSVPRVRRSRRAIALAVAALLAAVAVPLVAADATTEIRTPSTQTLTTFTQTGGTFTACADAIDGTTCDYLEGDDGTGGMISPMLLPNGQGTVNDWTAVGCAEGAEWDCVNDGPSHDSDTTYVSGTVTLSNFISEYEMQDCTGQAWCVPGQTVSNVVAWTFARFVAGVNTDPEILIEVYQGGTFCHGGSLTQALTAAYANYSSAQNTCSWTTLNLDTLRTRITTNCALTPCDEERATAVGATVSITQTNYRGTFQYDFASVRKGSGSDSILHVRMAVPAGESWACAPFNWLTNSFESAVMTFSSTSQTELTYDLDENRHVSTTGGVRFRCVDQNQAGDTTQGTINVDAAFIRTTYDDGQPGGGGDLGALLSITCAPGVFSTPCWFDLSPLAIGVFIERTDWYADGMYFANGTAASGSPGNRHTATLEGFHLRDTVNVTVRAWFTNGQVFLLSEGILIDNVWVAYLVFFLALAVFLLFALKWFATRKVHADRSEAKAKAKAETPKNEYGYPDWERGEGWR